MKGTGLKFPVVLVEFADAGGKEIDAGREVILVAGFDGLMDVACWDRDRSGDRAACDHALKASGVSAAATEDFRLPLDFVAFRGGFHEGDHAVVADDRRIHELDRRATAEGRAAFLRRGPWDVVRDRGVEPEAKVGLDLNGGRLGATKTDFFLDGEYRVEVVGWLALGFFQRAQRLDEHENRRAVVEGFYVDTVSELNQRRVAGDEIADSDDFDDLLHREAGVDEVIGNFHHFIPLLRTHQMDGFGAHHPHEILAAVDDDPL